MATVRVLGSFQALLDGAEADLGGPRQRCVLARLVVARGRMVPAERLVEQVWPDGPPPRAAAGLQAFVSHLRRALEPDRPPRAPARVLVTDPPGYALRLPERDVDAWRFDALVDRAATGDPAGARRAAEEALDLWRGPAYAEFAALPWAATEASRLEERRRLAVERRAEAMLRLNAAAEAVPDLETHVAVDPLREEAWRLLALALYRAGRQGDALDALRRARAALAEELGVDPGPALRRLEHDILTQAPALEVTDLRAEAPSTPYRAPAAPTGERDAEPGPASRGGHLRDVRPGAPRGSLFVGRRAELERLRAAAERGGLALVSGDAGMGKTSLAERLAERLAAEGRRCAWGRAPETGGAPAAWPWAELLRDLAADTPPADDRLAPLLDDTAAATAATTGDATTARFRLHLAVADYLAGLAERTPLLLVLDDLHWADDETLALLVRVLGRVRGLPVLVVGTFRHTEAPDRLTAALAAFARHEPTRVALDGLSAAEVAVLVRAVCRAEVGDAALAAIAERTGGNPFFARETARLLDAEGPAAATGAVPAGVGDVLRRRLARLPEPARAVLRDAAVVGRDADLAVLADLSGDEDAVLDAVEAGLAAGLVTEPAPGRMRFAHALVRDTLYADLSRTRRVRLHGRVAAALERHRPGEVAALAHHHLEAGTDPDRAVRYARLAAEAAEGRFAHAMAADLYERAADTLRARGRMGEALEIEAAAIRACALSGRVVRARERRLRAVAEARALGDLTLLARVIVAFDVPTLWTSRKYNTVDHGIVEAAEAALAGPPGADPELRVRLLTSVAIELEGEPHDRGPRAAEEAVAAARALGRPRLLAVALNGLFLNSYRSAGDNDQRLRIAEEMLDLATRDGLATYRVLAHLLLQQAHVTGLDLAAADAHRAEGLRLADQYGLPLLALIGSWYRALGHVVAGRYAEAERAYTEIAGSIARTGVWGSERGVEAFGIFCVRTFQGREGEMADQMRWVRDNWPDVGAADDLHALALAALGRRAEARAAAAGAAPVRRDYFFDLAMTFRARRAVALDDRELAAECYTALLPYAGRLAGGGCAVATIGPVAQTLGDVAVYLGRPGEAAEHYATAERVAERVGAAEWARAACEARDALDTTAA
ncbi:ATP-binding protein [Actinomadura namibiensis]|uniref:DNA-binding SARP family transcriptional activator n=1 Tax=Actinomadura namibiensis TaxID=182080 RepID=A0A7W3LKB0_ACTNM|nr:AfsR/SARP family transcriptional regulator [Actinomadura namibiensis]MBA8949716.1 DNA-binding SARP family transcriptional activator [Actinomadura namibiensis]